MRARSRPRPASRPARSCSSPEPYPARRSKRATVSTCSVNGKSA
jgi:hypothetical protein